MGILRYILTMVLPLVLFGSVAMGAPSSVTLGDDLPKTLNPLYGESLADLRAQQMVFERLFYNTAITSEPRSRLVSRYELTDGGRGIQLTLREDLHWADGTRLTPADVCFTVDAILEPENPITWMWRSREELVSCEVVSEHVAEIQFREPVPYPKDHLGFAVLPAHRFDSAVIPEDHPIGREVWGSTGMHARLSRRRAVFEEVVKAPQRSHHIGTWTVLPDQGLEDLFAGRVQGLVEVGQDDRRRVGADEAVVLKSYDLRTFWYVAVRQSGPLADVEVRRKLDAAIDREMLRMQTQYEDGNDHNPPLEFISGPFLQSSSMYNRKVRIREHEDADLSGLKLRLGIPASDQADDPRILEALAKQWRGMGAEIEAVVIDAEPMAWRPTPAAIDVDLLIVRVQEPMRCFERRRDHLFGTGGRNNPLGFSDAAVDAILDTWTRARTIEEREEAGHALHQRLHDEAHAFFLWRRDTKSAWTTAIRNNTIAPGVYFTDARAWKAN